ncbi:hypothetical protein PR202_gb22650 [Eleusine coracana subsp. coracana]|uniref:Pentatricopeptide repeat-containing protein n=1 Tax=Eleusine coracana subsp. coracana TaxID=191504 RepID=A0AAV5FE90_ELECO|nr:hypothetical protein PR202_gb22650 [Eleusine coracana subsp. coracana]
MPLLKEMVRSGVAINKFTATSILLACSQMAMLREANQLHGMIMKTELYLDQVVKKALISTYASLRDVQCCEKVFEEVGTVSNRSIWSAFISGMAMLREANQLHGMIMKTELYLDQVVKEALISTYASLRDIQCCEKVFEEVGRVSNRSIWSAFISGVSGHNLERSIQLLRRMCWKGIRPNDKCYASIFSSVDSMELGKQLHSSVIKDGFIQDVLVGSALSTIEEAMSTAQLMVTTGFHIDSFVCSSILSLCADMARPLCGKLLHGYATKIGILYDLSVSSSLVKLYSKSGNLDDSRKVFDEISAPDVVTWTAIIDGYAQHGSGHDALAMFDLMMKRGVKPDTVILVSVLSACGRNGLVEEGIKHFSSMRTVYGVEPTLHHYCCMVDLLGRSGRLAEAKSFIEGMPVKPDLMVYGAHYFAACRVYDDAAIGQFVESMIREENYDSGCFATLSNIRANSGDWEAVEKIRKSVKGVKKEPGWSMVV